MTHKYHTTSVKLYKTISLADTFSVVRTTALDASRRQN